MHLAKYIHFKIRDINVWLKGAPTYIAEQNLPSVASGVRGTALIFEGELEFTNHDIFFNFSVGKLMYWNTEIMENYKEWREW